MKKLYSSLLCLFLASGFYGQTINNADFENWVTVPNTFGGMDPQDWTSTNAATAGANVKGITRSTDKYSGTYALQLSALICQSATDTLISAVGLGVPTINFATYKLNYEKGGKPFTTMITSVNGYYKFTKGTGSFDTAYAIVLMKDPNSLGYVGMGKYGFVPAASYTPFQINITPPASASPDSLVVAFFYKSNNQNPVPAGKLLIDSLSTRVQVPTGLSMIKEESFTSFPNPCYESLKLQFKQTGDYKLELFSSAGQLCQSQVLKNTATHELKMQEYENGIYFIRCTNLEQGTYFTRSIQKE